ncbi:MAG: hypothetical protein MUF72_13820 [Elainella sp. Prado103]|nr:hypothetical protein [Elainella sp. Prado103]
MLKRNSSCLGYGLLLAAWSGVTLVSTVSTSIVLTSIVLTSIAQAQSIGFEGIDLVCYMQTVDGRTIDLTRICGSQPRKPDSLPAPIASSSSSLSPYTNLGGLDIYGRGNNAPPCFGLDDQGNPCPSSDRTSTGNSSQ